MNDIKYTDTEIEIFKRVITDYKELKKEVDDRIKKGYNYEMLLDYIRHLSSCDITNYEINNYFDFNYCDMCISIYSDDDGNNCYLGDIIEVWNDKESYYIGTFSNVNEIKKVVLENE